MQYVIIPQPKRKLKTWVKITLILLTITTLTKLYIHTYIHVNNQPYTLEQCRYDYRYYNPNYIDKQCGTLPWKGAN